MGLAQTPERAEITSVTLDGTGCDRTRAAVSLSPDFKDLSVLFDDYALEIGQGTPLGAISGLQKDCRIHLNLSIPRGWQMAFKAVDYRGYANLPASAWGFHRFSAILPQSPVASMREVRHRGPIDDEYTFRSEVKPSRYVWSPCNLTEQRITLVSQLAINYFPQSSDRSQAILALDSADLSTKQNLSVVWRTCAK